MVIFPLAPDQTIAQMWSNGARGGGINIFTTHKSLQRLPQTMLYNNRFLFNPGRTWSFSSRQPGMALMCGAIQRWCRMNQESRVIHDCKQLLVHFVERVTPTMDKCGHQKHVFTFSGLKLAFTISSEWAGFNVSNNRGRPKVEIPLRKWKFHFRP